MRRAKARAALRGQPLARYIEEGLEERLQREEAKPFDTGEWLKTLPSVSKSASKDLDRAVSAKDFREVDASMWQ